MRVVVDQKVHIYSFFCSLYTYSLQVVQVIENAFCNCATFADSSSLVTGSSDYTVRLWKVTRGSIGTPLSSMRITLSHIMRIHTDEVNCVAASRTWSVAISGSKDGSAALWDLNRGVYIRSIWHGDQGEMTAVDLVAINESTVSRIFFTHVVQSHFAPGVYCDLLTLEIVSAHNQRTADGHVGSISNPILFTARSHDNCSRFP